MTQTFVMNDEALLANARVNVMNQRMEPET
jgi:hypothetical protein